MVSFVTLRKTAFEKFSVLYHCMKQLMWLLSCPS